MKRSISLSFTILLLINCIITCPVFAQSVASSPQPPIQSPTADDKPGGSRAPALNGSLLSSTFSDTAKVLKSPAHWNTSDWLRASAIAGTALGLYSLDGSIRNWAQDHRSKTTDQMANYVRLFGDPSYTMPALGAVYLGAEYFKNEKLRNTATLGLESLFVTGLFTEGLKRIGHRVRPGDTTSSGDWNGPSLLGKGDSFPSGHSA